MRKSLKIGITAAALFLVLGAVAFVYAGMQNGFAVNDDRMNNIMSMQEFLYSNNITMPNDFNGPCHMGRGRSMFGNGIPWAQILTENTTLSTVQGSVVSTSRDILILSTETGQIRVLIPNEWTLENDIVNSAALFNGTFTSSGQTLTVNVLKNDIISNANLSVNMMLGYEVVNATGTHAYTVLPFNIQAAS